MDKRVSVHGIINYYIEHEPTINHCNYYTCYITWDRIIQFRPCGYKSVVVADRSVCLKVFFFFVSVFITSSTRPRCRYIYISMCSTLRRLLLNAEHKVRPGKLFYCFYTNTLTYHAVFFFLSLYCTIILHSQNTERK